MDVIVGKIVEGNKLGREIGFPTLNVQYSGKESGVYVGKLMWKKGEWHKAAVHVGSKPTVESADSVCESFLIEDIKDIPSYGVEIRVILMKKIRDIEKFSDLSALKKQIAKDVEFVKNWYNATCL